MRLRGNGPAHARGGCRYNGLIISFALFPMPDQACCNARLGRILWVSAAVAVLAGCGSFDGASRRVANAITPYKIDIVQGNFVSREQVQALQPGMSRQQVREILGTPLVTSVFHGDRWEYVFTIKRPSSEMESRKLTVFFQGDTLARFEGDEMPSETEFVATLGSHKGKPKVPYCSVLRSGGSTVLRTNSESAATLGTAKYLRPLSSKRISPQRSSWLNERLTVSRVMPR